MCAVADFIIITHSDMSYHQEQQFIMGQYEQ